MTHAYDSIDLAERRREIAALDFDIAELRAERRSLADRLTDWTTAIEDIEPEDVAQFAREIRALVNELTDWGKKLETAIRERREYGD